MSTTFQSVLSGYSLNNGWRNGFYNYPSMSAVGQALLTAGQVNFCYLPLSAPVTLDRISCNMPTSGSDPGKVRLGLYTNDSWGRPDRLLVDAGVFDAGALGGTGPNEIAVGNIALPAGSYWIAIVGQTLGGTAPTLTTITSAPIPELGNVTPDSFGYMGWTCNGIAGALPHNPSPLVRVTSVACGYLRVRV